MAAELTAHSVSYLQGVPIGRGHNTGERCRAPERSGVAGALGIVAGHKDALQVSTGIDREVSRGRVTDRPAAGSVFLPFNTSRLSVIGVLRPTTVTRQGICVGKR